MVGVTSTKYFAMQNWPRPGILWLGRLVEDPGRSVITSLWSGTEWVDAEAVMKALIDGDPRLDEVDEPTARGLRPDAFA